MQILEATAEMGSGVTRGCEAGTRRKKARRTGLAMGTYGSLAQVGNTGFRCFQPASEKLKLAVEENIKAGPVAGCRPSASKVVSHAVCSGWLLIRWVQCSSVRTARARELPLIAPLSPDLSPVCARSAPAFVGLDKPAAAITAGQQRWSASADTGRKPGVARVVLAVSDGRIAVSLRFANLRKRHMLEHAPDGRSARVTQDVSADIPADFKIRPIRDQIIIEPLSVVLSSIIVMVEHTKPLRGIVKAVGPGVFPKVYDHPDKGRRTKMWDSPTFRPCEVKVGDVVELGGYGLGGYAFPTIRWGGVKHLICREEDVSGVVDGLTADQAREEAAGATA